MRAAAISMPRDVLYERINLRVEKMMEQGLAGEVKNLLASGVPRDAQSMQALGYKETVLYLDGRAAYGQTVEDIQRGTRHYAKRQETFFRREKELRYLDGLADDAMEQAEKILI